MDATLGWGSDVLVWNAVVLTAVSLAVGLLGGTAVGGFIAANTGLVYGIAGGYFIVALAAGWYLWNRKRSNAGPARCLPALGKVIQNQ